jgi:hypothetical protein
MKQDINVQFGIFVAFFVSQTDSENVLNKVVEQIKKRTVMC